MKERSLFGPLLLIATGVVWLLVSMNVIPAQNLWALTHVWPFVLIGLGVGMLLGALWAPASKIVSALIILGVVAGIFFAPQLGWARENWNFNLEFGGGVAGSGVIKTETRETPGFSAISLEYPAEVVVRQGSSQSVKIEADDNLLPQLRTQVRDGTLEIENQERDWSEQVDPSRPVKITITVKDLRTINFSSAGTLLVTGLKVDELKMVLSGAGDVTFEEIEIGRLESVLSGAGSIHASGAVDEAEITISGFGSFDAPELTATTADVRITGAGSAALRVVEELTANVSGAGSVDYYGSPSVDKNISGAGSVNRAGD